MTRKGIVLWALVLAVLCSSCAPGGSSSSGGISSGGEPEKSAGQPKPPPSKPFQQTPDASQEEKLLWATWPVLSPDEMPGDYKGLELPVAGATGYTSVELPLWKNVEDSEAARQAVAEWEKLQEEKRLEEERLKEEQARQEAEANSTANPAEPVIQFPGTDLASSGGDISSAGSAAGSAGDISAVQEPGGEPGDTSGDTSGAFPEPAGAPDGSTPAEPSPDGSGTSSVEPPAPAEPPVPEQPPVPEEPEGPEEPPTLTDGSLAVLKPGTAFTILRESEEWWEIRCETDYIEEEQKKHGVLTGWVEHRHCMINLPDVIPSIVYDDTNAYSSVFISCGRAIDGITGEALYKGSKAYNPRLGEEEFMMPVLYSMANRLCAAQRAALEQGNTLVLYEGYRPYYVQTMVSKALTAMMQKNPDMRQEVAGAPWGLSWFIATGISNHQQGYAVDMSLARVSSVRTGSAGEYPFVRVDEYELYEMPTPIHELSRAAATYTGPVNSLSATAWKSAKLSESMNEPALGMQGYCTGAGLTPLASEWWHFNDLHAYSLARDKLGTGGFVIDTCCSTAP